MERTSRSLLTFIALVTWFTGASAAEENFTDLDLATLMNLDVTVTSAAKRAQSTADAAAAVYVITREDIRRSSATTIPDLLRVVPGLQVARITTRSWAVTARGFNSEFANKLQVLVDGRSIYATIFSGVMWEEQFVPLDQIERIEVVRGPGGALWGINAMNGVINIITRRAGDDLGLHVSAGAGVDVRAAAGVRYGARVGEGDVQLYADLSDADPYEGDLNDLDRGQVGARYERTLGRDHFAIRATYSDEEFGEPSLTGQSLPPSAEVADAALDWRREYVDGSQTELSTYYSFTDRGQPGGWDEANGGVDMQHTMARRGRHLLTFGAGYRYVTDDQRDPHAAEAFSVAALSYSQWSTYLQDESFWFGDRVRVIAGAKLEDFKYTGLAFQPTLRTLWHASEQHTLWAAASRAVRTPSRFEMHSALAIPLGADPLPTVMTVNGSEDLDAEQLDAYELGWRWRPDQRFTLDVALFRHEYAKLIVQTMLPPQISFGPPPQITVPVVYANAAQAQTSGVEIAFEWLVAERLRLQGGAYWLDPDLPELAASLNAFGADPGYGYSLRARCDVAPNAELDATWRIVDDIEATDVPSYQSVDVRLGWRPAPSLELSISVENLLDDEHVEFFDEVARRQGVSIGRSAFARFSWKLLP